MAAFLGIPTPVNTRMDGASKVPTLPGPDGNAVARLAAPLIRRRW
jgi:hypothetical protein